MANSTKGIPINTGSSLTRNTHTGLSTQIVIKINGKAVGAVQRMTVDQNRGLANIVEVGTDGIIEIIPNKASEYKITVDRIVFDNLRLPESFSRAFRVIGAQRLPFDIDVYDLSNVSEVAAKQVTSNTGGVVVTTYKNCWFESYSTPYNAGDYVITESASIRAETAFVSTGDMVKGLNGVTIPQTDSAGIETDVNNGGHRGSMDYTGLFKSVFTDNTED